MIGWGLTAASTAATVYAQKSAADAQNETAENQTKNINKATVDGYVQLNRQGLEDAQNNTVEGDRVRREMAVRIATAKAGAAGSGVSGLSVDALLLDLAGKGLEAGTTSEMNYARTQAARGDQGQMLVNGAEGALSRIQTATGPGAAAYLGAALRIADATSTAQDSKRVKLKGNQ